MTKLKKILLVVAIVLLLAGIGFVLFAPISNCIGKMHDASLSDRFERTCDGVVDSLTDQEGNIVDNAADARRLGLIDDEGYPIDKDGKRTADFPFVFRSDLEALRQASLEYNHALVGHQGTVDTMSYEYAPFKLEDYGVYNGTYACLTIPAIDLRLPVSLGASENSMRYGITHMYGTSLPLDEKNTNVALAGHTGYAGRIFFDNLRNLSAGDTVLLKNYWEEIRYTVVDSKIVSDTEVDDLLIEPDRQLLTLITCISNGKGGFDRYLVICEKN